MVNALRLVSVQRGYDPRDFVLVAFGGAGPVHANAIQRDCEVPTLVIPQAPGSSPRPGCSVTDLKRDSSLTLLRPLEDIDVEEIERAFAGLEETGAAELDRERLPRERIAFVRQVDMRYVGQSFELTIPLAQVAFDIAQAGALRERFHAEHDRVYGFSAPSEAVELVSLRLTTVGRIDKLPLRALERSEGDACPEGAPAGVLRRGRRLRRVPHPRPVRAGSRRLVRRAGSAGGARLDGGRPSRVRRRDRRRRQPRHRKGARVTSYGIVLAKDVMVAMRDGIRLASDIYRPARDGQLVDGRFPTIMLRTPYDKTDRRYVEIADFFTPRGYAVVLQDMRDRYRSEGTGDYYHVVTPHTGEDGYDTVEWIAAQSWSNGRIGTVGSSYAGITQVRAALERPPHLTAIWPDVVPTNSFHNQSREGGAMQQHMFWALFIHAQDAQDIADDPAKQADVWNDLRDLRRLFREGPPWERGSTSLRHVPPLEQTLVDYCYARRVRRVLAAGRERLHAALGPARGRARHVLDRLVRPVPGRGLRVLRRDGREERGRRSGS